jgi:DNA-binding MarR family transcriptional regulator
MKHSISPSLQFILDLAKAKAVAGRRFDSRLGGGIGLNEFMILFTLSESGNEKMRRIDLAQAVGLTASGITRLLAPMEKIGLIQREVNPADARISYVALASGGKRILSEQLEKAELLAGDLIPASIQKRLESASSLLGEISKNGSL